MKYARFRREECRAGGEAVKGVAPDDGHEKDADLGQRGEEESLWDQHQVHLPASRLKESSVDEAESDQRDVQNRLLCAQSFSSDVDSKDGEDTHARTDELGGEMADKVVRQPTLACRCDIQSCPRASSWPKNITAHAKERATDPLRTSPGLSSAFERARHSFDDHERWTKRTGVENDKHEEQTRQSKGTHQTRSGRGGG